jgi:thioredoxin-related protein
MLKSILICFLLLGSTQAFSAVAKDPYAFFFDQNLGDLQEELENAQDDGKKGVFVFFEMDECPFCHRMKETVLSQPSVQEHFKKNFVNLAIDIEGDIEIVDFNGDTMSQKEFAVKNRVRATPVMAFYDFESKQVVRYTGATSGVEEFMWLAEFYEKGIYKMKSKSGRPIRFASYKRLKKKQLKNKK